MVKLKNIHKTENNIVFETERIIRNETCTIHNIIIDPHDSDMAVLVNSDANGYHWADDTVRGTVPFNPWMKEYFTETDGVFRNKSIIDYTRQVPSATIATEANGNLFWNLGNWIFCNKKLNKHYREILHGKHIALIHSLGGDYKIMAIDFDKEKPFEGTDYAVSGIPIISDGKQIDFFKQHPNTDRILISDFYGDLSHLLNTAMCVPLNRSLFYSICNIEKEEIELEKMSSLSKRVFNNVNKNKLSKYTGSNYSTLESAITGDNMLVELDDHKTESITRNLMKFGYKIDTKLKFRGDFYIDKNNLHIRLLRTTFGHSMVSVCDNGTILLTKAYTDYTRKGGYIEDMAEVVIESSSQLNLNIKDTIITSNGGDLRVYLSDRNPHILSHSKSGNHITYRGDENYGITSAFLISKRGSR